MHRILATFISALLLCGLLAVPGCGGAEHPLRGHWHQHSDGGQGMGHGMTVEFDTGSDRLMVHGPERPGGGHDHFEGSYALDGDKVTLRWTQAGEQVQWDGTLDGDKLTLAGPDGAIVLERSEEGAH